MAQDQRTITGIVLDNIEFTIPNFNEFGNILHDRLHSILRHYEEPSKDIMLITNFFDRDAQLIEQYRLEGRKDLEALIYCGTENQRRILEINPPPYYYHKNDHNWKKKWKRERDKNWEALFDILLRRGPGVETFQVFDAFRGGKQELNSIKIGTLKSYFSGKKNILKENELPIISDYFNVEQDLYIGIPLLGTGLFQGIVWIVFEKADKNIFADPKTVKRIIKYFQVEYDNLLLDWDTRDKNLRKKSVIKNSLKNIEASNPIQRETRMAQYYKTSEQYHEDRIKQSDDVFKRINTQYNKTAIISTLLDSYAHNISAHSLTTLSWWFRERFEYQYSEESQKILEDFGRDTNPLILYAKYFKDRTLSRELYPLFKFLLEKGAFWSGITRQTNKAGKTSSFFNIIWYDFVNNPLYLGTIAHTERVTHLKINFTIYESEVNVKGKQFTNLKVIKEKNGQPLDGTFVVIKLKDFEKNQASKAKESVFVEKGELFDVLKNELSTFKVFFPGGVVGKHSFFTLLENEIRNVKHFKGEALKVIQDEGLTINISIHERPAFPGISTHVNQLYKIGVWLKHPVFINSKLLLQRIEGLGSDIVTEDTYQPKLGGNYQDKICAAMLMTNTFDDVQDQESPIGKLYYPWVKTASSLYLEEFDGINVTDFEVSFRKYQELAKKEHGKEIRWDQLDKNIASESLKNIFAEYEGKGYLKKYFHLWQGADVLTIKEKNKLETENLARFRFVCFAQNIGLTADDIKSNGIIRLLQGTQCPENIPDAYSAWMPIWLKSEKGEDYVIDFSEGYTPVGRLIYKDQHISFENETQIEEIDKDEELYEAYKDIPNRLEIKISHGGQTTTDSDKLNYRTHGSLITGFCKGRAMSHLESMPKAAAYELFETITTKICLFDRRLYNRLYVGEDSRISKEKLALQEARLNLYRKCLQLDFRNEIEEDWKIVKDKGFLDHHFLLLHLSFIEGMKDEKGNKYSESRIIDFINDQILQGQPPEVVGNNFILAITTGRGRMEWWEKIKNEPRYARFVTFNPIESIIAAVENALQISDDFDLKYNLTKLLFGS